MKRRNLLLSALVLVSLTQVAHADLKEVGHEIKDTTKSAAIKTGHAARDAGHATANAARRVGHRIAATTRRGYRSVKQSIHRHDEPQRS